MRSARSILVVDIGSGSVGITLAARAESGAVTLSHTTRTPIRNVSGTHTSAFESLALEAVKQGFETVQTDALRPDAVEIFLAAPWYKALIRSIDLKSREPLRITEATVRKAVKEYKEHHSSVTPAGEKEIESIVSQAYVNEYPTALKKQLRGTSLQVALYESFCDASFAEAVGNAARAAFPRAPFSFHSFLFAFFAVMRDRGNMESAVLLDVGGEITDIAIVNRGSITFSGSFPVGSLSLTRSLAKKGSVADAASRLTLFARNELSDPEMKKFETAFDAASEPWRNGYASFVKNALKSGPVSGTVYLSADAEALPWFEQALARASVPLPQKPILITPDFFHRQIFLEKEGVYDAFLSLEALYGLLRPERITITS